VGGGDVEVDRRRVGGKEGCGGRHCFLLVVDVLVCFQCWHSLLKKCVADAANDRQRVRGRLIEYALQPRVPALGVHSHD